LSRASARRFSDLLSVNPVSSICNLRVNKLFQVLLFLSLVYLWVYKPVVEEDSLSQTGVNATKIVACLIGQCEGETHPVCMSWDDERPARLLIGLQS
jgi:hypothetical protein